MKRELYTRFRIDPLEKNLAIRLDRQLLGLRKLSSLIVDELNPPFRLSWRNRMRAWRLGYTSKSYAMYQLERNDPKQYVSEYAQKVKTHRINGAYNHLIDDKLSFSMLMERHGGPYPPVHAVIRRGKLHPLKPDRSADPPSWLRERIEMGDGLVIKPLKGFKGKGFVALQKNPTGYLVNGVSASMFDIEAIIGTMDHCYLSSFVGQAEYARRIYPHTTNTVRLLTVWDYTINKPFIAAAVQRIGTQRSFPVDNWKSGLGGLSSDIELDGGELGPAVSLNSHGRLDRHRAHPETQRPIAGVRLPNWSAVKGKILSIAEALSFIPDAAWDCVITDDGFSILEMNGACALFVFQVHHPLLRDPRVRRFYQHHGVIRK